MSHCPNQTNSWVTILVLLHTKVTCHPYTYFHPGVLRSFNICSNLLRMFYQSVLTSAIYFAVVCWVSRVMAVKLYSSSISGREMDILSVCPSVYLLFICLNDLIQWPYPCFHVLLQRHIGRAENSTLCCAQSVSQHWPPTGQTIAPLHVSDFCNSSLLQLGLRVREVRYQSHVCVR